jgi:hypothetical protein
VRSSFDLEPGANVGLFFALSASLELRSRAAARTKENGPGLGVGEPGPYLVFPMLKSHADISRCVAINSL